MSCANIQNRLSAFADGELAAGPAAEVIRHVATCSDSRAALARRERLSSLLAEAAVPAIPAGLSDRIRARGRQRLATGHSAALPTDLFGWKTLPAYMKAAASIVMLIGLCTGTYLGLTVTPPAAAVAQVTAEPDPATVFNLSFFADAPAGTLAQVYLDLSTVSGPEGGK